MTFDDNRLASALFGQFDQNLALIEQRLGVEASARGNHVLLRGDQDATIAAADVLDSLYDRLQRGQEIGTGDVDGAIRVATYAEARQETLPGVQGLAQITTRRRTVTARSANQDRYLRDLQSHDLVFGIGPAGTGKTYLAVAYAASLLERGVVDRVILSRPAVEAGERLGFLPGDLKDKVDPYLRPLYDALYDLMPAEKVDRGIQNNVIEIAPLAFMRGRTLAHSAIILDEAQNCTPMQMKMFLTRLGEDSHMIITGDPSQIDLPAGQHSGLKDALRLLEGIDNISVVRFDQSDVVRNPLVQRIVEAYDRASTEKDNPRSNAGDGGSDT